MRVLIGSGDLGYIIFITFLPEGMVEVRRHAAMPFLTTIEWIIRIRTEQEDPHVFGTYETRSGISNQRYKECTYAGRNTPSE